MPRGGPRVGAGRPKGGVSKPRSVGPRGELLPLEYMLAVMNDENADQSRRDRLAVAAAPYLHARKGEGGKKEDAKGAAKTAAAGKFTVAGSPKLVVNNS